jgi:hypothetical protein
MPYFIAVLALVVISVSFTFFNSKASPQTSESITTATAATTTLPAEIVTLTDTPEVKENIEEDSKQENNPKEITEVITSDPISEPDTIIKTDPVAAPNPSHTTTYTDGTYVTQTTYRTPDRDTYYVDVTLTVADDIISSANVTFDPKAARDKYVKNFSSAYTSKVVGKSLEGMKLSRVGGASLTTTAFNKAITTIQGQAS